ncbi:RluA family pseudouridine synthase [Neptuniibacter sp. CAU 1671]|uniref:RluA family pseudouridine synthase n=1 Tax=Neptuniibacter sp. CAU 1671 TaxID=3032593 RepID=UPI0023DBE068|nr:RluA family pseudouridine synthase [Neptuniibacter sp. CAU 1671]MDF2182196.1 RluA family pseudouridine synthase [Neptuniibacter sp. CAU 1671]
MPKPLQITGDFALQLPVFQHPDQPPLSAFEFLQSRLASGHREQLPAWFAEQRIWLNQQAVKPEQTIEQGQQICLMIPDHWEEPVDTHWQPIWENDELMVVYKPATLPVSRTTRNLYNTLISRVRRETVWSDARLMHRLDTETDGLILLAKNQTADRKWKPILSDLIISKRYHARVYGRPEWQTRACTLALATRPESKIRSQMHIADSDEPGAKHCISRFQLLESDQAFSLIECTLATGRRHQLRAHLANLGHPIVGDKIYAHQGRFYLKRLTEELNAEDFKILGGEHHQLTASHLSLRLNGQDPATEINLPDRLNNTLNSFYSAV